MYFWRHHSHRYRKLRSFTLRLTISGSQRRFSRLLNSTRSRRYSRGIALKVKSRVKMSDQFPQTEVNLEMEHTSSTDPVSSPLGKLDIEQTSSTEPSHVKSSYSDEATDESDPKRSNKSAKNRNSDSESDRSSSGDQMAPDPNKSRIRQLSKDDSTDPDPFNLRRRFVSKQVSGSFHFACPAALNAAPTSGGNTLQRREFAGALEEIQRGRKSSCWMWCAETACFPRVAASEGRLHERKQRAPARRRRLHARARARLRRRRAAWRCGGRRHGQVYHPHRAVGGQRRGARIVDQHAGAYSTILSPPPPAPPRHRRR
jgi:hypothetical protein